jgi:translation initiation factor 2B subunit (eIF-2B alpha/beta/delta family)
VALPPEFQRQIDAIARDRRRGAAELALAALPVLGHLSKAHRRQAGRALIKAHPAMASVRWLVQQLDSGADPEHLVRHLILAAGEASCHAADLIGKRSVVMTHSASSAVERAFHAARGPFRIIATESRPNAEGARFARRLATLGFEVTLIPDAAVSLWIARANVVFTGADAITPEGLVNKVGTRLVALAAREARVPFFVVCTSDKIVEQVDLGREDLFDLTPSALITGVITENGIISVRSGPSPTPRQ